MAQLQSIIQEVGEEYKVIADQLDKLLNSFSGDRRLPEAFAQKMCQTHRTLQSCWMRMLINTIIRYAELYEVTNGSHTDRRNEHAVRIANRIKEMRDNEELQLPFI